MLVGPVFTRELTALPRSLRLYLTRAGYVAALFGLAFTTWLIYSQSVRGISDMTAFGLTVFSLLGPLQVALAVVFSALLTAAAVAQEKDRRTLDLLLMTNLSNVELVLGKLLASLLMVLMLLAASFPLFLSLTLLGGISYLQVLRVIGISFCSAIFAGSLGSTIALWRERTFQSLALTALLLVLWILVGEILHSQVLVQPLLGAETQNWAIALSPLRAILAGLSPEITVTASLGWCRGPINLFMILSLLGSFLVNLWAILRVRVWNPIQEADRLESSEESSKAVNSSETKSTQSMASRHVWDNPILWREICTWAYGKRIIIVRIAYLVIFSICCAGLFSLLSEPDPSSVLSEGFIHSMAKPLIPLIVLGLVLVNALAVTSLTNERDLRALDLLLVTDLSPKEIIFGKLAGVFYNSKEMLLLPIVLCAVLWYYDHLSTENLVFLIVVSLVMTSFAAMVGVHVGMTYADSRTAIGVSLSTVLFLLLGIAVCMRMMMAVESSFFQQMQAFSAFMLGGGTALYMALGRRLPSNAIALASGVAPIATFYVITSFLGKMFFASFFVTVVTYSFATAAMLIPAIDEFDVATGRTSTN